MTPASTVRVVALDRIDALAAEGAPPPAAPTAPGAYASRLDVAGWLTARGVSFRVKPDPDARGRTVYVLAACPFHDAHADPDACVMQAADGKLSANCFHDGCTGRGWQAFKDRIGKPDPEHYDPPLSSRPGRRSARPSRSPGPQPPPSDPDPPDGVPPDAGPPDGGNGPPDGGNGPPRPGGVISIDPQNVPVAETMGAITDVLLAARDCYRRTDQLVRVRDATITPVLSSAELAGLVNCYAEVLVVGESGPEYRPLPTGYANTWLNHPVQAARLPAITLFTLNPVYTPDWRIAPRGFDAPTGIYSAGPDVAPGTGTSHLDTLLRDFCFRTPGDRTNYVGMLLTAVLIPHFVGSKPAVLFNGNQPALGKSVLAQILAILRDGRPTETASYNPNDEEFEKRLGAIVRRGVTTILIDNAKAGSRAARIDSAVLERSITDPVLSFRLLGYSREIRAENSHIFCITANTPEVSRDLVTRSVVVHLFYEGDPTRRTFTIPDPEAYALDHRVELLGELLGLVERWRAAGAPPAPVSSRFNKKGWGPTVGGILAANGYVDFLANAERSATELDETRRDFEHLVETLAGHPPGVWTPTGLAELAVRSGLFAGDFQDVTSDRARATRIGLIATRYVGETFPLADGRTAEFTRDVSRKGNVYAVRVRQADDSCG